MTHFDEKTIDLFVQDPQLLDDETRVALQSHLQECIGCRSLAEFLRSYYRDLEKASRRHAPPTAHQAEVLKTLIPRARVIPLFPYRPRPDVVPQSGHEFVVLAAKSIEKDHTSRFETVATLASEEEKMLLRIVHDNVQDKFTAYLHADDPATFPGALVSFEAVPLTLVLDERGQMEFTLSEQDRPADWSLVGTVVRPSLASFSVPSTSLTPDRPSSFDVAGFSPAVKVLLSHKENTLSVQVTGQGNDAAFSSAVIQGFLGNAILIELKAGAGKASMPELPEELTIRLYP